MKRPSCFLVILSCVINVIFMKYPRSFRLHNRYWLRLHVQKAYDMSNTINSYSILFLFLYSTEMT